MSRQLDPIVARVLRALNGAEDGEELAALIVDARDRAKRAEERQEKTEATMHALAWIVADLMDGAEIDDVVDDLPSDARRLVIACRHESGPLGFAPPRDQYGPLPRVPARASVMRSRVRDIDVEPVVRVCNDMYSEPGWRGFVQCKLPVGHDGMHTSLEPDANPVGRKYWVWGIPRHDLRESSAQNLRELES